MKNVIFIFAVFVATVATSVVAHAGYYTPNMTCKQVRHVVQSNGEALLYYGDGLYDLFVAHQGYCYRDECAEAAGVPTKDRRSCFAGYICEPCRDVGGGD
jgi:hypothetical protein